MTSSRYVCLMFDATGRVMVRWDNVGVLTCHDGTAVLVLVDGRKLHISGCFILEEMPIEPEPKPQAPTHDPNPYKINWGLGQPKESDAKPQAPTPTEALVG